MTHLVLDTSVAVAWYLPESFSARAGDWQERLREGTHRMVVPGHHYWEFGNVLHTHTRRGDLSTEEAILIFQTHLLAPLQVVEPDREKVLSTALAYDATVYDAIYIELSRSLEIPLITAARTTTPWVQQLGDQIVSVLS